VKVADRVAQQHEKCSDRKQKVGEQFIQFIPIADPCQCKENKFWENDPVFIVRFPYIPNGPSSLVDLSKKGNEVPLIPKRDINGKPQDENQQIHYRQQR